MQSALNVGNENDTNLVTAETLRGMTITKEALTAKQKASILDSLMSSMVRIATEQGGNSYAANLNPKFDPVLLADIVKELTVLGYTVTTTNESLPSAGEVITIRISW